MYSKTYSNSIVVVEYFFHEYEYEYEYRKMYWSTSMSTTTLKYIQFTTRSMVWRDYYENIQWVNMYMAVWRFR